MREILFRGKDIAGNWHYGVPLIFTEDYVCMTVPHTYNKCVIPETVGQFTGLTDKNGKRIFEGDICRFREWSNGEMCWVGKVHFEHQQFVISGDKNKECETSFTLVMSRFISENIEVIGNIHDNPEFLEEKK